MLQPATFCVPLPFSATTFLLPQEPKTASDTPAGAPPTGPATGPTTGTGTGTPTGTPPAQTGSPFDGGMFLWIALFMVVMLFFTNSRERKARKEQAAMLAAIKKGDRIVTTSGIHAIVDRLDEKTVVLLLDSVPVTFERAAIARVVRDEASRNEARRA